MTLSEFAFRYEHYLALFPNLSKGSSGACDIQRFHFCQLFSENFLISGHFVVKMHSTILIFSPYLDFVAKKYTHFRKFVNFKALSVILSGFSDILNIKEDPSKNLIWFAYKNRLVKW